MSENRLVVAGRRRAPGRVVALAGVVGLAVAVGVVAARALTHETRHGWRAAAAQFVTRSAAPGSFADIVDAVKPAMIGVQTKLAGDANEQSAAPLDEFFRQFGGKRPGGPRRLLATQGSGFFISADGYAVTNNHVVEGTQTAQIQTDDQKSYAARVVGADPVSDLALLKVDGRSDFPYVELAGELPRAGDWVIAVGNPFGLGGTVTAGIVSARERNVGTNSYDSFIQIDAPINRGDSGGPSFDLNGRVIGVNTMIFSPSGGSIGIAFAVPAQTVRTVIPQLKEKGAVTRGWLGVQIQPVTPDIAESLGLKPAQGALVAEAQPDGPAAKAGIRAGDVIGSVDGDAIKDPRELSRTIGRAAPGTPVKLGLRRQDEEKTVTVTLAQLPGKGPSAPAREQETTGRSDPSNTGTDDSLGLKLESARGIPGAGGQGVVITGIDPTGLAADKGFEPGDVILEAGGKPVQAPADIETAARGAREAGKHALLMRLKSGETMRFVAVPTD